VPTVGKLIFLLFLIYAKRPNSWYGKSALVLIWAVGLGSVGSLVLNRQWIALLAVGLISAAIFFAPTFLSSFNARYEKWQVEQLRKELVRTRCSR
jgi:membrane protein YdbS with pleckstrin-like domain